MYAVLALAWIVFSLTTDGIFMSVRNLSNLFLQTAAVSILAMGMVLVIVTRNIDLSVGSHVGAVGAAMGALQFQHGGGAWSSICVALMMGIAVGCWHGFWVAYRRVPSIIVTLASMLALRGLSIAITQGQTQSPLNPDFLVLGQGYLMQFGLWRNDSTAVLAAVFLTVYLGISVYGVYKTKQLNTSISRRWRPLANALMLSTLLLCGSAIWIAYRGIPYAMLIVLLIALVLQFLATKTVFGRQLYAIGGNPHAAEMSGVNVRFRLFGTFLLMGVIASFSAVVFTARVGGASAGAGAMMELDAIAAAIIGGTSLSGGVGTIPGAFVGALVMATLDNGMSLMNLDASYQLLIKGAILLLAVWFDIAQRKEST